ncbi:MULTISPECIES: flavin monoamine oxidase family protein [unclassified Streptomyces]|uniref:flavin monoamine oxidase family protein n=1 Tax=unclassified Streptomyces TaxID=2593676 RepID=UPI0036317CAB
MFDESYAFPSDLRERVRMGGGLGRVAVIGAGVAGLVAAYELQHRGYDVVVYERASRPGGRVRTHHFWDDTHAELGAMRIPDNHHCVLQYVQEFGLRVRPFINSNPDAYYHLRGRRVRVRNAHHLYAGFDLRSNEEEPPLLLLDRLLRTVWETLSFEQQHRVLQGQWDDPALGRLVSVSLWQFVHEHMSKDAWDFVGHATGLVHYEHSSLLEVLVDHFGLFHTTQLELVDGMDSLVRAFVERLVPNTVRLSTDIREIALTGRGASVRGRRMGTSFQKDVDFVICCVPAPALDRIAFLPGLPHHQRQAIRGISYASSSKSLLHLTRRRWESRDGLFGGGSFTDLPIQQCWYPSDNARPAGESSDGLTPRWTAQDPQRSEAPTALLGAYLWGANATRFAAMSSDDRDRLVLDGLEQLHPGIAEDVDDIVHWNWGEQAGMGGGAFAHLRPGEHGRHLEALGSPHPVEDPRVFFAGEHLSGAHAWCQGAAQSALHVVSRLLGMRQHAEAATPVGAA